MWPFEKKYSLLQRGFFQNFTDWHTHILPGVDDGFRKMDSSLEALAYFEELGIREVWCTPHIMEEMPNTTARLREIFAELKEAYSGPIQLQLGSENMMDGLLSDRLEKGDFLPIGINQDRLLVEMSCSNPSTRMDSFFSRIRSAGFFPLLAHPERYHYMTERDYRRLHDDGVLFQLNVCSLCGAYGADVEQKARWMLKNDMYDIAGSDIHNLDHFKESVEEKIKSFRYEI